MKAEELRLGNLVQAKGNVIQVTSINYDQLLKSVDVDEWYVSGEKLSDLEPIPLTPEWLERCGFVLTSNYHPEGELYCKGQLSVCYLYHFVEVIQNIGTVRIHGIKYVHQLQNLYFALTGTELTIKETVKA